MGNRNSVITASHSYIQPHADGQWTVDVARVITTWLWKTPENWNKRLNAGDFKAVLTDASVAFSYLTISNECPGTGWGDGAAFKFHKVVDGVDSGDHMFIIVGHPRSAIQGSIGGPPMLEAVPAPYPLAHSQVLPE